MCLTEPQLLRLLAGELSEDDRAALDAHLASCPQCRQQLEVLRATWDQLGQWESPAAPDLSSSILAAAAKAPSRSALPLLRIAAAILIACGVGVAAGLSVPSQSPPPLARQVSTDEVVESLGLDVLGSDTGLTDGVLEPADASPEDSQ